MLGLGTTQTEINGRAGDLARSFQRSFDQVAMLKSFLDATPDANLVAMGFLQSEVTVLKSAVTDLAQFSTIWTGQQPLAAPKDFTVFVRQLWGIGAF